MDKIISFGKGIRRQPSVGEDGELSELVNLIPKNGELVNVRDMKEEFRINGKLLAVHELTGLRNYIIKIDDILYFSNNEGDEDIEIGRYGEIKSVTTIGNTVVISAANGMHYAIWNGSNYSKYSLSDFSASIGVFADSSEVVLRWQDKLTDFTFDKNNDTYRFSDDKMKELYARMDSIINSVIASKDEKLSRNNRNETFKYVSLGIAALKMYDNSYVAYSNIFTLDPPTKGHGIYDIKIAPEGENWRLQISFPLTKYSVYANVSLPDSMKDIVSGIDIFLSTPQTFYNLSEERNYSGNANEVITFPMLSRGDIAIEMDGMQYYKSVSLSFEDIQNGQRVRLKRVYGTEDVLPMFDLSTSNYIANSMFVYNGRVNLAGITQLHTNIGKLLPFQQGAPYQGINTSNGVAGEKVYTDGYYGRAQDAYAENSTGSYDFQGSLTQRGVIEVDVETDDGISTNRYAGNIKYPLPPILSYPSSKAKTMRIYIMRDIEGYNVTYHVGTFPLTGLKLSDMSVYVNADSYGLYYTQPRVIKLSHDGPGQVEEINVVWDVEWDDNNPNWRDIADERDFEVVEQIAYGASNEFMKRSNVIKYTPAYNPFSIPAINTLAVGNRDIVGISTSVKALSPSQFGQFPLYAFCSDGIWTLEVAKDGTYLPPKVVSNDVCNNPNSIIQIESSVVFTTDQGLKLIQGSEVALLSVNMDGYNVNESDYFPAGFFAKHKISEYDGLEDYDNLVIQETRDFRQILSTCKIAYDYPNQMLRIFPEQHVQDAEEGRPYKYYVYSLTSKEFASVRGRGGAKSVIAGYPSSFIQIGQEIYSFDSTISNDVHNGLLLTRPIDMGEPFAMKKLQDMKLHYTKHNKEKGTFVKMVVYVSNDGVNWYVLPSLRKRSFKYYRVALITKMTDNDALSGMIMRYEVERTNKIR